MVLALTGNVIIENQIDKEIKFYKGRERWIRLETDAYNFYNSKINN